MGLKSFGPTIDCSEMKENFWPLKQWPEILFHFRTVYICLGGEGKTFLVFDITQQCFVVLPQRNLFANNLSFH